ncbi:MAG: hypothetical protein JWO78_213 [Micavibrio sp.]|nr:hypothetical protein [Micavibrio sp.]
MTYEAFGQLSFSQLPGAYDRSVADPFQILLQSPDIQLMYLIELKPYDPAKMSSFADYGPYGTNSFCDSGFTFSGGVSNVFLSDRGFITEPSDAPANQYFSARVENSFQMDISILTGTSFGDQGQPSYGSITIQNGDGELDALQSYYWEGRPITIKTGSLDFRYGQFATILQGQCNSIDVTDDQIIISITDNSLRLDQNLDVNLYKGTGGLEGSSDLNGKPKPLTFGEVYNIEPVLVNAATLVYQVHDGSILSVDAVRDRGVALTLSGDVSDITASAPPPGGYYTQLSAGLIRLGSTPGGVITADVHGDNAGGYVNTVGDIAQRIVKTRLGYRSLSSSEIDGGTFNTLSVEVGPCGAFLPETVSGRVVLDSLIRPALGFWTFSRQGVMIAGIIDAPGTPIFTIGPDMIDDQGVELVANIPTAEIIKVGYRPSWTVQTPTDIASGATDAIKTFVTEDYRYLSSKDLSARAQNAQLVEQVVQTTLALQADAERLLTRMKRVYGQPRKLYRLTVYGLYFRLFVGNTVNLTYPRHGLDAGKNMLVTRVADDAETNSTILELWG